MRRAFAWLLGMGKIEAVRRRASSRFPRARLGLEALEDRTVPAAPTLVNPGTIYVPTGQTIQIPLNAFDPDGDPLTFAATSDQAQVTTFIPVGNPSLRLHITIDGTPYDPLILQLFQDLTPHTVAHITDLVNDGFYDNRIFHRIIPDFMAQLGNDQANEPDNTTPAIDDEYHPSLTFNGFGQLAMANTGARDSGRNQMFITDADLSVSQTPESGKRPPQHLNFRHTIFGQLTDGFDTLQAIIAVGSPGPLGTPTANVTITSAQIFTDLENGVLRVSAARGFLGTATITVTVTDSNGEWSQEEFTVVVVPNTDDGTITGLLRNDPPFLAPIPEQNAISGKPLNIPLGYTDIDEGDPRVFAVGGVGNFLFAMQLVNNPPNATVKLNQTTGVLTVTPTYPFTGELHVLVGVRDASHGVGVSAYDTQLIRIHVAPTDNTMPTLGVLPGTFQAISGKPLVIPLTVSDPDEGDLHWFAVGTPSNFLGSGHLINQAENAALFIDQGLRQLIVTPRVGFTGSFSLMVGVRDNFHGEDATAYSTQVISIEVVPDEGQVRSRLRHGRLRIRGTPEDDVISVQLSDDFQRILVVTSQAGTPESFDRFAVRRIVVRAGRGDDTVTISANVEAPSRLIGRRGNDFLQAGAGRSILRGNRGDDHLIGGSGDDRLKGGRGNDILEGGLGNDILKGKKGSDIVVGSFGDDRCRGGKGDDYLDGGIGGDIVFGGGGADYVWGGLGPDRVRGGKGQNHYGPADAADLHDGFHAGRDRRPGSFTDPHLLGTRMDLLPGAPEDTSGGRIQAGDIDYYSLGFDNPPHILPTYGPHHAAPVPTGFSGIARQPEEVLTNLDIGHIWITYDPALIGDRFSRLLNLVSSHGINSGIVLTPNSSQGVAIVLSSWARQMVLHNVDSRLIHRFIFINRAHGPTAFASP
jgi:cyclophilin family peptidyl-prolyl cis-trans isomerase